MNIYVSNLGFNVRDEDLKQLFTPFGEVSSAKVINDRETGRSRGFGFVDMPDNTAAAEAMQQLNESSVDGRPMKVSEAKPKTDRSDSGGGYSNNRNSGGGGFKSRW